MRFRIRVLPDWALWLGLGINAVALIVATWVLARTKWRYFSKLEIDETEVNFEKDKSTREIRISMAGTLLHSKGDEPCFIFGIAYRPANSRIVRDWVFPNYFVLPDMLEFEVLRNGEWKTIDPSAPMSTKKGDSFRVRYSAITQIRETVDLDSWPLKAAFFVLKKYYLVAFDMKYSAHRRTLETDLM